ncbi:MAG: translation initiation factor IF-3 [Planctomycetes bacterium]|nr:translation initiation factor IF-3 [Planctomycetota bacterium]
MRPKRRPPAEAKGSSDDLRINERIRIPRVLLIDHEGKQHGVIATEDAMKIAQEAGLDLVEVSPTARPPVCRVMNYGQYKYQLKKKAKSHKSHQAKLKEVRLHPATGEHDVEVRLRQSKGFLEHGDKVLVGVVFKGREIAHRERGEKLCKRFIEELAPIGKVEKPISMEGKRMSVLIAPMTKDEIRANQKKAQEAPAKPPTAQVAPSSSPAPKPLTPAAPAAAKPAPAAPAAAGTDGNKPQS